MKKIINYFKLKYTENIDKKKIVIAIIIISVAIFSLLFSSSIELFLNLNYDFSSIDKSKAQVHFIDVGQGDCVAIRFDNNETMLIDCGASSAYNNLTKYLNEIFFHKDNKKFDYAILTHTDSDHIQNFSSLLNNYRFNKVYVPSNIENHEIYGELYNKIKKKGCEVFFNFENIEINVSSFSNVKWLSPTTSYYDNDNDYSPIILANISSKKFLFTGDASDKVENVVLMNNDLENIDVLKAAHHGSSSSTSYNFLSEIKPKNIVFSVGENNYGHPSSEVIENIINYQTNFNTTCELFKTSDMGNIVFKINQELSFETIKNINDFFFIRWWVVVIVFVTIYAIYFIATRKYAINRVYESSLKNKKRK